MKLTDAKEIASQWVELLSPSCRRIEIAGSIRRGKQDVKDIDIVCVPRFQEEPGMFDEYPMSINLLDRTLGKLFWDQAYSAATKDGPRHKTLRLPEFINLELWIVLPPAQWGVQLMIRTGPSEFSTWMVTQRNKGGALPSYLKVDQGAVWHRSKLVETPDEADLFKLANLDYIEPAKRVARWHGVMA